MPFIRYRELRAWDRLCAEGIELLSPEQARSSNKTELHIGFLNMMPDRAFHATERQFLRLVSAGSENYLIYIHPFTIGGLERQADALTYTEQFYDSFTDVTAKSLDGLVLTGANPGVSDLNCEKFWPEFEKVMIWAKHAVPSVMCSCLASHAILNLFHSIERTPCVPGKRWGVFSHSITQSDHPLVAGIDAQFDAPRSHVFEMTAKQLEASGMKVLAISREADFHIAVSSDGFKWVFLQGHPEYDAVSLLKEYHREVMRFVSGEREDYPEYPQHYLNVTARERLNQYRDELLVALENSDQLPAFPESDILPLVENTWSKPGQILFRNWIELIGSSTNSDRECQTMMKSA